MNQNINLSIAEINAAIAALCDYSDKLFDASRCEELELVDDLIERLSAARMAVDSPLVVCDNETPRNDSEDYRSWQEIAADDAGVNLYGPL